MQKNRRYAILVFLISAILVSVLFNLRVFLYVIEKGITDEVHPRLYYVGFNFIIELVVFFLVALLNYVWIETLLQRFHSKRGRIPFIILCNLVL